jgi:diguanylate cyclase (GGDEF)-like protein
MSTLASQVRLVGHAARAQSAARRTEFEVVVGEAALLLLIGAAVAASTVRRRHRLQLRVVRPVGALLDKVRAVGRGEFGAAPVIDAPAELLELRDELIDMSSSLRLQKQALANRAEEAAASNRRLKMVLGFARDVSDSLTLAHCLAVVATAARRFAEAPRARVWLVDDSGRTLTLRHDSITGDLVPLLSHSVGYAGLGQAAQTHRVCLCDGLAGEREPAATRSTALAVPMLKGARLVGVIEILLLPGMTGVRPQIVELLEAMAAQAATAIDAAVMYALTESLSLSDPLTRLANRRQLDQDLALEIERAARHHRPLSFLMLDIDHFKSVNDTFGHAVGDAVLVEVAGLLAEQMRAGDTIYRYGGEEFAVLARDTDGAGATAVAERLRRVIEQRYATRAVGDLSVTVSVGVAELSADLDSTDRVVAAADTALYAAKRGGRNRVEVSGRLTAVEAIPRVRLAT